MTPSARPDLSPAHDLAQGFAAHALAWARAAGASTESLAALRTAAVQVSLAVAEGHVCVPLAALVAEGGAEGSAKTAAADAVARLRAQLVASGVVGHAQDGAAHPLLLDGDDRLYLRRHFVWEQRLATALVARLEAAPVPAAGGTHDAPPALSPEAPADAGAAATHTADERLRALLGQLFPPRAAGAARPDWQQLAAALALDNRLTVISGGPGTGKTTTVAALLACLVALDPGLRIALAAPTGKAAARMLEALRARATGLPAELAARLPQAAHTLHRLLGVTPAAGRFRHHAGNPLALDVLVVDEASMLDLALATRLFDALPPTARVILLGDKDQLAAVEAGAVFAELSADPSLPAPRRARLAALTGTPAAHIVPPPARAPTPLAGCVAWFAESHRFAADSGIGRLAAGINAGAGAATLAWLRAGGDDSVRWLEDGGAAPDEAVWQHLAAGFAPYRAALAAFAGDPAPVFAAFERFRVLCAVHDTPRGVDAVNARLARELRAALAHPLDPGGAAPWYPGRPVIVLKNDYVLRLFNGDVGLCLPAEDGALRVIFPAEGGGWRAVAPLRLPPHASAFALTVHKAQGSEFAEALVLLPAGAARVMTRELLYTAATRAAQRLTLAGSGEVFTAACANPTRRHSGLIARMHEAAQRTAHTAQPR